MAVRDTFTYSLLSCFNECKYCFCACCCPCIIVGDIAEGSGLTWTGWCLMNLTMPTLAVCLLRNMMRKEHGIEVTIVLISRALIAKIVWYRTSLLHALLSN
ncbi:hypothetical protein RF11_11352 [Thelohanellus kitauei]|uniref:Uncharacterized protein n=1 Tax=Thelohanellus kitauei TaxID=669202 RepID=A0A0C2N0T5_THEKT|nr:hypothetical protein RF11_11352 [Thelohanellus kitauei]